MPTSLLHELEPNGTHFFLRSERLDKDDRRGYRQFVYAHRVISLTLLHQ